MEYTAHATARGQGRNGEVKSNDDVGLELRLAMPRSLGGKGDGQNPEQLFAMGYAGEPELGQNTFYLLPVLKSIRLHELVIAKPVFCLHCRWWQDRWERQIWHATRSSIRKFMLANRKVWTGLG